MDVRLNGEPRTLPRDCSLSDLLSELAIDPRMVVVERNREIVRDRNAFDEVRLEDGDVLELVHFVGGG